MIVYMFVDETSSMHAEDIAADGETGQDIEYKEIEEFFRDLFPDEKLMFKRNVTFNDLSNTNPDYYVFDIGGMDIAYDTLGKRRTQWCRGVVNQIADHPNTVFVPWSQFTQGYAKNALLDLIGEEAFDAGKFPPNLIVLSDSENRLSSTEILLREKLKARK